MPFVPELDNFFLLCRRGNVCKGQVFSTPLEEIEDLQFGSSIHRSETPNTTSTPSRSSVYGSKAPYYPLSVMSVQPSHFPRADHVNPFPRRTTSPPSLLRTLFPHFTSLTMGLGILEPRNHSGPVPGNPPCSLFYRSSISSSRACLT
jgi:hypothetical protein